MRLFELARRPPSWLRHALAGLMLAFVLSSIAHVTHKHEALVGNTADVVACGYCLSFGGLADASVQRTALPSSAPSDERIALGIPLLRSHQSPATAQPRAPPFS